MKSSHSAQRLKAQQLSNTKRGRRSFGYISLSPLSCTMSLFNYLRSSPLGLGSPMCSRKQLLQKNPERQRHTGSLQSLPGLRDCSTPHRGRLDNASWASAHSTKNVTLIINYKKTGQYYAMDVCLECRTTCRWMIVARHLVSVFDIALVEHVSSSFGSYHFCSYSHHSREQGRKWRATHLSKHQLSKALASCTTPRHTHTH